MATHVEKVSDIWVPALSAAEFTAQLQSGDILFCSGEEAISHAIERETKSPWSHVGYVWLPGNGIEPLFIEAIFGAGVHVARLGACYTNGCYKGDVVLARRNLSAQDNNRAIARALSQVGDHYDWQSEVQQAAHMALGFLPQHATKGELYCSGLVWYGSTATTVPMVRPHPDVMPSPEDNWCDPIVVPVAKLLMGTK